MPTQMPKNGRPRCSTFSFNASTMPSISSSPRRQSAKAPTPGSTTRAAAATSAGSLVTLMACALSSSRDARSNALAAECRLPEP